jgi:hypothetical protein
MVLPREDKAIRSLTMCRRSSGYAIEMGEISRDSGYHFIRMLEQEHAIFEELTLRKKRLLE